MRFAISDGTRVEPAPRARAICPSCGSTMLAKCGSLRLWHWSHISGSHCDPWHEPETQWHRDWKNCFPQAWQEVVARDAHTGERHVADVKTASGFVLEFQNSAIAPEEMRIRELFYGNMAWVVNAATFKGALALTPRSDSARREAETAARQRIEAAEEETRSAIERLRARNERPANLRRLDALKQHLSEINRFLASQPSRDDASSAAEELARLGQELAACTDKTSATERELLELEDEARELAGHQNNNEAEVRMLRRNLTSPGQPLVVKSEEELLLEADSISAAYARNLADRATRNHRLSELAQTFKRIRDAMSAAKGRSWINELREERSVLIEEISLANETERNWLSSARARQAETKYLIEKAQIDKQRKIAAAGRARDGALREVVGRLDGIYTYFWKRPKLQWLGRSIPVFLDVGNGVLWLLRSRSEIAEVPKKMFLDHFVTNNPAGN